MFRTLAKKIAYVCGFEVKRRRIRDDPDTRAARLLADSDSYRIQTSFCPLYSPEIADASFLKCYADVPQHTLVSADRCYLLFAFARYAVNLSGAFAECGVFKGGTALLLSRVLANAPDRELHLFDSFEGLSRETAERDNYYKHGDFSAPLHGVQALLQPVGPLNTSIHKGWIPSVLESVSDKRFAFVHVDVDLYQPALDCCSFFYPRLVRGGVMIFDDYGFPACRGERTAVDEFFKPILDKPIALPTGQALVIKSQP